jgi:glycosyltransferase involved in cell wall biosynthesis
MFSILLPSRDRLGLLKFALQSVLAQGFDSLEIIVSDNASSEDYSGYISSLGDRRIKYLRSERTLSVTENWNVALNAARGEYVLMLGDDDALVPELLRQLRAIIEKEGRPTVIYMMAYHYMYPNVLSAQPDGSFLEVVNSELFTRSDTTYWLDAKEAEFLAREAVSFHHKVSFNAQHFVWRRDFTTGHGDFFRDPYPDYFACFYTFAKAKRILVLPTASIIVGIAKQSFGYFFFNNRQDEGAEKFAMAARSEEVWRRDQDLRMALDFAGTTHYRNWLLTSIRFQKEVDASFSIDVDLYCRIQIVESIADKVLKDAAADLAEEEWSSFKQFALESWSAIRDASNNQNGDRAVSIAVEKNRILTQILGVYFPAEVRVLPLSGHSDIMDAFAFLATQRRLKETAQSNNLTAGSDAKRSNFMRLVSVIGSRLCR